MIPFALLLMVARALFFSEEVRQEMRALKQEAEVAGQQREKLLLTSQKVGSEARVHTRSGILTFTNDSVRSAW